MMDNKLLGELLTIHLGKYGFKDYGGKLFYLDLPDSIVILEQLCYNGAAELYLGLIIKVCHPSISKISKALLRDKMIIDSYSYNRLFYPTASGNPFGFDLYDIPEKEFESKIDQMYSQYIESFSRGYLYGIECYNRLYDGKRHFMFELFRDSAEAIGHPELAADRGHDWLISDQYLLLFKYKVDNRYVNENTASYLMENVIKKAPEELSGKALTKWCNQRCKELLLVSGKRISLGWGILFPFVDGKPLKYCGYEMEPNGRGREVYLNEDTGERFYYIKKKLDKNNPCRSEYEIIKVG